MRIFMLVQHPEARGPAPRVTEHLVSALRSLGCSVVTHHWGQHRAGEPLLLKLLQRPLDVLSVWRSLSHQAFDVAVVNTAHDWRTLARDMAVVLTIRRHCRPVLLQLHGSSASNLLLPGHFAFKLVSSALFRLTDGIMVLSTEEQRQWQAFDARRPVFVVKNPYAGALASSSSVNRIETSANRILFVGRLIREKGIFELVEALADVIQETKCELVIVGEGPKEDELWSRIHRLRIEEHVSIAGYLTGFDLESQYRQATIFVLPSWEEGFPTVLAEAMDEGLPIVTTRIRGAADHLVAGENALFVEPGDVNALATAINTLLADKDLRSRMAKANRNRVRIFEPRVVASEYLGLLESLIRERSEVRRRANP